MNVARRVVFLSVALSLALGRLTAPAAEAVLDFSGTDSYVDLGMPDVLQIPSDGPFTVEGWMYPRTVDDRDMLYSKNSGRNTTGYSFLFGFMDSGDLALYSPASGWVKASPETNIGTERWVHLAVSYDGTNATFYLDGVAHGTSPFSFVNVENNTVKLGGYYDQSDVNGYKSEVRVWDHARSEQEIQNYRYFRLTGYEPGLLGYWPMNEGSGSEVLDSSGNASTGTVINASWTTSEDLTLLPPDSGFLSAASFTLADIETGNNEFTNSNEVDLVNFPIPEGHDLYQITLNGESAAIDPEAWAPTSSIPARIDFPEPATDTNIFLYAWFTNSTDTVDLLRSSGTIAFYRNTSDVTARVKPIAQQVFPGVPARIVPEMIDDGSSSSIGIFAFFVSAPEDETPELEGVVTLSAPGDYSVTLTVMDLAGNTDRTTAQVTLYESTSFSDALWEIPRNQMEARGTGTYRENVPTRVLSETSYWRTDATLPQALIFDLRGHYPVAGVSIYSSSYRPKGYAVYTTDSYTTDSSAWGEPVAQGQLPDASNWHSVEFTPSEGNFMVLQFTERYSSRIYIDEVRIFAHRPFVLASPVTGDTHFTNTNVVDVVQFPVLEGYDRVLVATASEVPAADDPDWSPYETNDLPETVTFDVPEPEGDVTLHAWFRDSGEILPPVGIPTTLTYVRETADVQAVVPGQVTAYAWNQALPAVVQAYDLRPQVPDQHAPYLGAESGATIGLHSLTVSCPRDATPERDDRVTLPTPGNYTVRFAATDRAGNRHEVPVQVKVLDMVRHVAGKRFVEDWTAPANTRAWPQAFVGRGPYPCYPPQSSWNVKWPQQWLIDYVNGERVTVDLTVQSGPVGRSEPHQRLYAYLENSGALNVDMRFDFINSNNSGSHNPALLARFHPRDWRVEANERRGYLLYMDRTGPASIQRVNGDSHATLASLSGVVLGGQWMTARLLVENAGRGRTRLRAKLWLAAEPEPDEWMLEAYDETPELQTPGRVGVFGVTSSNRRFSLRDLEAKPLFRSTLILVR